MPEMDMISELRALLDSSPNLARRLTDARSMKEVAEILARIAAENGLPMSAAELRGHFTMAAAAQGEKLRDDELGAIGGGGDLYRQLVRGYLVADEASLAVWSGDDR